MGTLYPVELSKLIKAAFKARKSEHNNDRDHMIEVIEDVKKEIESIVSYNCMLYIKIINIAAKGREQYFFKAKALGKNIWKRNS